MTITIELRPGEEQILRERARASGRELPEYVRHILEEHIRSVSRPEAAPRSLDQVLAPVWEGWRQSGMTEEQIDATFQRELEEIRRERLGRRGME
jgi:hypothetical protein